MGKQKATRVNGTLKKEEEAIDDGSLKKDDDDDDDEEYDEEGYDRLLDRLKGRLERNLEKLISAEMEIEEHETILPIYRARRIRLRRKLKKQKKIQEEMKENQTSILQVIDEEYANRRANCPRARVPTIQPRSHMYLKNNKLGPEKLSKQGKKEYGPSTQVEQLQTHIDKLTTNLQHVPGLVKICRLTERALDKVM